MRLKYLTKIENLPQLSEKEHIQLKKVTEIFAFRANKYYLSLIDWDNPDDPIRQIIIPDLKELDSWGRLDSSEEKNYTVIPGLQHKYNSTALLLISNVCGGICRYCFRKRIFMFLKGDPELLRDLPTALEYIREHKEITNILLTGGDPLMLTTPKLENVIKQLMAIDHVQIVRIGTKIPAFNPYRILDDPSLLEMIEKYSTEKKKIYVINDFNHAKELTDAAIKSIYLLHKSGAILANQTPLIRGLNDNPETLAELLRKLSFIGAIPYYVFQCRPALGNKPYAVPIEEGYEIFEQAKASVSGLAKRARFVMSHSTGKIEIVGKTQEHTYLKYHRAADDEDSGHFMIFRSNPDAYWLDDYNEVIQDYPIDLPYRSYGPE
ncbi:MAG: KamA family radical SAM protein [Deltaproteobacteria bacterium]|nr:KamA family radical SAM protein [Deltaproteobacteria bacterium]